MRNATLIRSSFPNHRLNEQSRGAMTELGAMASELSAMRGLLFELKESMGSVRSDVGSVKEWTGRQDTRLSGVDERLRKAELSIARSKGRNTILGAIGGGLMSVLVAFASRQWV
jgi:hypothetical protein